MNEKPPKGPIAWMTRNSVAANLLMFVLILGGSILLPRVKQEVFPEYELDIVRITVPYPGASPEEVEQGILLAIEDKVRALDGVEKVTAEAVEGSGQVLVEMLSGRNPDKLLQDVKNAVDQIESFPEEAERPIISLVETRRQVISLMLYGEIDPFNLRNFSEVIRDELLALEGITLVEIANAPPLEISIEIPQHLLRSYNLTLDEIGRIVRETALELPGGGIRTPAGEVLLRTQERRDYAKEFKDIVVVSNPQGVDVQLSDIATIREDFEETDQEAFYNGKPAMKIEIFRVGDQKPTDISEIVRQYVKEKNQALPPSLQIAEWNDRAEMFRERINLLLKNGILGLVLVLLLLGAFLEPRLAFWVTLGIPISVIGAFLIIPLFGDASINMVSLFAFIITLGIIVDDAIVVGENIYQKREKGLPFMQASIEGAQQIAGPVTFAVLTNIAAFLPLFFIPGTTGKIFFQIPAIVVSVFAISLIESLFVLPAHLAFEHKEWELLKKINKISQYVEGKLRYFIQNVYKRHLKIAMSNRYTTFSAGLALLILSIGLVAGGHIPFSYLPKVDSDLVIAQVNMTFGIPIERARDVQGKLASAAKEVLAESGGEEIARGIYTQIGTPVAFGRGPVTGAGSAGGGSHLVGAEIFLVPSDQRDISGQEISKRWREKVGEIVGAESTSFSATIGGTGGLPIDIQLSHSNTEILQLAAQELAAEIKGYKGVFDVDDGLSLGKPQINLTITPEGRSLGLTPQDIARQVRSAFYGSEALRQQRGRNEVKVKVRLPEEERETVYTLEELMVRTPARGEIPLKEAAELEFGRAYSDIRRTDARRTRSVTADVDEKIANANRVVENIQETVLPDLLRKYPGLTYTLEGQQEEQQKSLDAMKIGFSLTLIAIYALLAIPFKSYLQPIIVMLSIPFGVIGAVIGHLLLGYEISIMSIFGIVALSGVVVNDSLVLIVTTNEYRREGLGAYQSLVRAGQQRFRPILLTSLTTFFGLAPMIFETSVQARFLIPMAISLGFGILFTTFIVVIILPCAYMILEDLKFK